MDAEFLKQFANYGVGGVLGIVVLMFYRKDVRQFTELWKSQTEMLIDVVRENTESNVKLGIMIESLHRRLDENGYKRGH